MLHALIQGELIADPVVRQDRHGQPYATAPLRVAAGDAETHTVSVIASGSVADALARLHRGDAAAITGSLRPTTWTGSDGATRHGLSLTAAAVLTVYEARRRRKAAGTAGDAPDADEARRPASRAQASDDFPDDDL